MTAFDGYELYRLFKDGSPHILRLNGGTYTLQFEGQTTDVQSWLRVTDRNGQSIRLAPGWSSEACWNALTTLEQGRWASPIGPWEGCAGFEVPWPPGAEPRGSRPLGCAQLRVCATPHAPSRLERAPERRLTVAFQGKTVNFLSTRRA